MCSCSSVCKITLISLYSVYNKYILYNFIIIMVTSGVNQYALLPQDRSRRKATGRKISRLLIAFNQEHLAKTEKSYWKGNEQLEKKSYTKKNKSNSRRKFSLQCLMLSVGSPHRSEKRQCFQKTLLYSRSVIILALGIISLRKIWHYGIIV